MARASTTWKKGQSGNPRGRQKLAPALSERLREIALTPERGTQLVNALWDLAVGVCIQEPTKNGELRTYTMPPNERAIALIFDRLEGKPAQSINLSGQDGAPISIEVVRNIVADSNG